jgi:hypothetical protein
MNLNKHQTHLKQAKTRQEEQLEKSFVLVSFPFWPTEPILPKKKEYSKIDKLNEDCQI